MLAAIRPSSRFAWTIAALGIMSTGWSWLQPDALPSVTFVEHVIPLAFAHGTGLGLVATLGLMTPALALFIFARVDRRTSRTAMVLGAAWAGLAVAALVGNYPTPLVGYGFSPIVAYLLSWGLLALATDADMPR